MCSLVCVWVLSLGLLEDGSTTISLPAPHFHKQASDNATLELLAQFHGHIGPWVVAGARLGEAGRQAVEAEGYFDLRVECRGPFQEPPNSCFLDGVQVSTGATLGKRNLNWIEDDDIRVKLMNTRTGKSVVVRPSERLLAILMPKDTQAAPAETGEPDAKRRDHQMAAAEPLAREVAALPGEEILIVVPADE